MKEAKTHSSALCRTLKDSRKKLRVRYAYDNSGKIGFGHFITFFESVTCRFQALWKSSTPAASTILKLFIFLYLPIRA